ncbi:MAG TPA: GAF domain-containing protein [Candidatus Limnocylindria bacterium]|nr:GAF domain-containing protein [Candidatus Limnocylindria bacterium]
MRHPGRSRVLYLAAAAVFGAVSFQIVEFAYTEELDRVGLVNLPDDPFNLLKDSLTVHDASFIAWVLLCMAASLVVYRLTDRLSRALETSERRAEELALVGTLSAGLSGPLGPTEVATQFLAGIRHVLPPSAVATLLQYEETAELVRVLAQEGGAAPPRGTTYPIAALPPGMRTRLIGERKSFVVEDVAAAPDVAAETGLPLIAGARSFAALPLVSRSRLIGALIIVRETGTLPRDQLQLVALLGQYVAGALHNALSIADADARADREAVVNRISQRVYSNLDPDAVVASALEELGAELDVSRVIIAAAQEGELTVLHEWDAPGVEPIGVGRRGQLPLSALAAREGRTIAVRDASTDARLADPTLGSHSLVEQGTLAAVATPIGLGGQISGVLTLDQVGGPRAWTSQEIRLLEAVARELRTALEAAQLLLARERENQRMLALHRASTLIAAETDPIDVLREILEAAGALLGRGTASVYRWDERARLLRQANAVGAESGTPAGLRAGEGVTGQAFLTLKPVIANDYGTWEHSVARSREAGWRAAIAVPLVRAGQGLGVLTVRSTYPLAKFDDDDARLLSLFGDQAIAALTTAELVEQQRRAVEQLGRLNSAKSDFVSIVSHEFRTPLTGIQGFSELMRDEDLTLAEMKEYAGDINKDAQRLNRMITEMLDLDRMESGRMTLHRERTDINAIVVEAAGRLGPNSPRHPITLHLDPGLPLIEMDKDKVNQVLLNLLSNAVKYSPGGGEIAITTRVEGGMAHVLVRDSGLGIPPDSLEKVFERFSRLESGATRYIQGTGLGLPISRQIIEMHGGRAWVESVVGEGSVFQFTLPLVAVATA